MPDFIYKQYTDSMTPAQRAEVNKHNQKIAIKERLNFLLERSKINSRNKLLNELTESGNFFPLNRNTFLAAFDPGSSSLDIYAVLAIGRYFNVDMDLLMASEDLNIYQFGKVLQEQDARIVRNLNDYEGEYTCYMPSINLRHKEIVPCTLDIHAHDGSLEAILTYHGEYTDTDGQRHPLPVTYRGKPLVVKRSETICLLMTSETGNFLFLSFSYRKYTVNELYYRRGIVVTAESNSQDPLMMNFVLFPKPLPESRMPYVRGLLQVVNEQHQPYFLAQEMVEELRKEPAMQQFLDEFGTKKEGIRIDEGRILYDCQYYSDEERQEIQRLLLLLRNGSSLANRLTYPTNTPYSEFTKKYMLDKKEK